MKENNLEKKSSPKIETIRDSRGNEVSFSPERGGIITGIKLNGKQILYLDEETFNDVSVNVKGGIPVLFPNAGPVTDSKLNQHGFARESKWKTEMIENGFKETLSSDEKTIETYPYNFILSVVGKFEENGSFTLQREIENNEKDKEMPISDGFHPYFNLVGEGDSFTKKRQIKFDFDGGQLIEKQIEDWANGKAISVDNPKLKDPNTVIKIFIPSLGVLVIDASIEYKKIWVWSMPGKDFVCIEPVLRDPNGLIDNPEKIRPGTTVKASVNFKLESSSI